MNQCLRRQREKSICEPSALCSLKMCHIFWSFDKVCQYFIKLCFLYMVANKLYYWHAIFTLKLVLQIQLGSRHIWNVVYEYVRVNLGSQWCLSQRSFSIRSKFNLSCPACVKYMSCHPVLISSSSYIDFLSQPLMSHPESKASGKDTIPAM